MAAAQERVQIQSMGSALRATSVGRAPEAEGAPSVTSHHELEGHEHARSATAFRDSRTVIQEGE